MMAWLTNIRPTDRASRLEPLILQDQLGAIRRATRTALQVNFVLGIAITLVSINSGCGVQGISWFAMSVFANLLGMLSNVVPLSGEASSHYARKGWSVERHLRQSWTAALISGLVWSMLPLLCKGFTAPSAIFFLTIISGVTAGKVANSSAYARIPICFIVPPLLVAAGTLVFYAGNFDRTCLAVSVLLYLAALIRISRQNEAGFRDSSRLKNEATTLARSLKDANARAVEVAEQMSYRAAHDELTELLNRAGFMQEIELRAAAVGAADFRPLLCLMILDLDGFKAVNDLFGHEAGDQVLVEVARRLRQSLTDQFAIARLGGDEFAIFFELQAAGELPGELATRLIAAIEVPFAVCDTGRIGASIGVHMAQDFNIAEMLTYADEALNVAKNSGRNRHFIFDDSLRYRREMKRDVERDLRNALSEKELEVWYQPVFGPDGRNLVNLEALLRWEHPKHGWIRPEDLIATASMSGLSELLVNFILGEVCAMIQKLLSLKLDNVWVAMNVSPREVSRIAIDELVLAKLQHLGLRPDMLEIEITEETAMNIRSVQDKLNSLSSSGVRIAVDDFGVGYSSLASLRHMHVSRIKIDRCFVTGITESPSDQILVQTILKLGKSLGIEVVAEGIETAEDLRLLQSLGCELMQGYHLKTPASRNKVFEWLQDLKLGQTTQLQS